jgi:uncharacterized RDD family membrane protein YckC
MSISIYLLKRSVAYLVDCLICYLSIMLVFQALLLVPIRHILGITEQWLMDSLHLYLYVVITISAPVYCYFAFFDNLKSIGSFGKRLMNLKVTEVHKNERISLRKSAIRTFFKLLPWELAHLGVIFPTLLYFESEPSMRWLTVFGSVLFIVYFLSIPLLRRRANLYDWLLGTQVV